MQKIEIPLSKSKITGLIIGSLLFVAAGIFMLAGDKYSSFNFYPSEVIKTAGSIAVLFFGACAIIGIKKMFDKKMGLVIDSEGITENTSAVSIGFIPWEDIQGIGEYNVMSNKMVLIYLHDNKKYISRYSSWKKTLVNKNINVCGTPISISANSLQISYHDLKQKIESAFINHKPL